MNAFQHTAQQDKKAFQKARRGLQLESRTFGQDFTRIPDKDVEGIRHMGKRPVACFRNRYYLAAIFLDECERETFCRLTVNRTEVLPDGNWKDGITWDELMDVKRGIGMGDQWMTEIYPPDEEIVNVANMRHLFIVPQPAFAWVKEKTAPAKAETLLSRILNRFRK